MTVEEKIIAMFKDIECFEGIRELPPWEDKRVFTPLFKRTIYLGDFVIFVENDIPRYSIGEEVSLYYKFLESNEQSQN